jgi:serine phosphatase RsbU (regulator of sigma subunit)
MAVEPDRRARDLVDPRALEPLADAGRTAARGAHLTEVLHAIVEGAAPAVGAEVAIARVLDRERAELVVRAVFSSSAALGAELEGGRLPLADLPGDGEPAGLEDAPDAVRRLAERVGADYALVLPVVICEEVIACLELLRADEPFGEAARIAARIAATQVGLAVRAFGPAEPKGSASALETVRAVGDAFAAAADAPHTANHVLRLARELSGAEGALLWRSGARDRLILSASAGRADEVTRPSAVGSERVGDRLSVAYQLGEPMFGLLQLLFAPGHSPSPELVETLHGFAVRAADVLRENDSARGVVAELEQTRALLAVVGQAAEQLSVTHTLDTALAGVAELVGVERLAVYLLEDARLTTAAARGLAGPHPRAAEALLQLALGPYRGRGMFVVPDAAAEPRLAAVADAIAEAGIEGAIAVPLVVGDEVTGMLCVYSPRGRTVDADEATLLSAVAGRLAVAVQNARLHEQATRLGTELEQALASEREAARRLGALYEISRAFAQSLSLDVTLEAVARTVVEVLDVDAAVLRMPDPRREQLLPLALHVSEERLLAPVRSMLLRPQSFGSSPIRRLFRGGDPIVLDATTAVALGSSHALLVPFLEKGATAAIVPIATPAEVLGSLTLVSLRPDHPVDRETIDAALAIGGQAALAIDNARLYQQQKDFADAMQRALLPQVRPPVAGIDIGEVYAPSAHVEVGGDLYDYLALEDGRLAVVLGDVTGHGIDAAADMAMAKYVFRSLAREHPQPADFLAAANEVVVGEIAPGKFITMLYLLIDPESGEIGCACAGHPPPRLVDAAGNVRSIEARGLALGVDPGETYEAVGAQLEAGGSVVLYTDGVIEARRAGELYGVERLDALLARRYMRSAEDIAGSVIHSARGFTGGELSDDCAVVVLKRR